MSKNITITIDGKALEVEEGRNLVTVAEENGIFIPSLCYYKHLDPPLGTCRVCTCKVNGKLRPACITLTEANLDVELDTPALSDARQAIVEMMFAEGNHFCPSCEKSGDCDLQHMAYEMGISHSRYPHLFKDHPTDFSPKRMVIEHNRCVKCRRCVEEVFTNDGARVFSFCNRGNETEVGIDYEQEAKLSEEQAVKAMHMCPTGAILVRGKSMARPFGDRKYDLKPDRQANLIQSAKEGGGRKPVKRDRKVIATTSLAGCFGCHMSMLDVDLGLLDLVEVVDFHKSPITDIKAFTQECDLGLIEGGCCNSENVEVLREFRRKCKMLVSVGECAIWGGVPAMRNTIPLAECLEVAYLNAMTTPPEENTIPYHTDLPKMLDKVYACHEIVKIDHHIPGCPPSANHIWKAVGSLLWGEEFSVLYSEFKYD